jgi:gamma-glutamylcyclotransferase (GGCT)/AIG2-like uncharacterized protein YtfP
MITDFVFAYGSAMNYSDLRSWLERNGYDSSLVLGLQSARLDGYDYVWNYYSSGIGGGMANIEPKERSVVRGGLIEIDDLLLKALDRKEGHPVFYSRGDRRLQVTRLGDGSTVQAWVYRASGNKGGRTDVWPTRAYKKLILDAAMELGLPEDCIARITDWKTAR